MAIFGLVWCQVLTPGLSRPEILLPLCNIVPVVCDRSQQFIDILCVLYMYVDTKSPSICWCLYSVCAGFAEMTVDANLPGEAVGKLH